MCTVPSIGSVHPIRDAAFRELYNNATKMEIVHVYPFGVNDTGINII